MIYIGFSVSSSEFLSEKPDIQPLFVIEKISVVKSFKKLLAMPYCIFWILKLILINKSTPISTLIYNARHYNQIHKHYL